MLVERNDNLFNRVPTGKFENGLVVGDGPGPFDRRVVVHRSIGLGGVPEQPDDTRGVHHVGRFQQSEMEPSIRFQLSRHVATLGSHGALVRSLRDMVEGAGVEERNGVPRSPSFE